MCSGGRGQVLTPWPNRLGDGRFDWAGREWQTALTEPEQHNAIHGLARWANWTVADEAADSARLTYRLYPQPGWPWILDLAVTYSLSAAGLEVRTEAINLPGGAGPCPFGAGWHPYLAAFGGLVDDAVLTVPAATHLRDGRPGAAGGPAPGRGERRGLSAPAAASAPPTSTPLIPTWLVTPRVGPSWSWPRPAGRAGHPPGRPAGHPPGHPPVDGRRLHPLDGLLGRHLVRARPAPARSGGGAHDLRPGHVAQRRWPSGARRRGDVRGRGRGLAAFARPVNFARSDGPTALQFSPTWADCRVCDQSRRRCE